MAEVSESEAVTCERATPKWVFGPNGKLRKVPPNTLARQWNPETGEPEGVLIEESRTNLLLWSEDFTNEAWHTANSSVTDSGIQSVIVGKNWQRITANSDGVSLVTQAPATGTGTVSATAFFRKGAGQATALFTISHAAVTLDLATGTAALADGSADSLFVEDHGGGYRLVVTKTYGTDESIYCQFGIINSIAGEYVDVIGVQLEEGTTPSSYIPTTDSPVTRAADEVYRTLGDEFNPDEGTLRITAQVPEGEVVASLGDLEIVSDDDEMKTYVLSYGTEISGGTLELGKGIFQSLEYFPRVLP